MKKRVLFRAPVLTQSGYGVHARQVAKALLRCEDFDVRFQLLPWGVTPWLVNVDDPFVKTVTERSCSPNPGEFDLSVQLQLPNEWDPRLALKNIGVTAAVETTTCNPEWASRCNLMSSIIVPSQFTKNVLNSSGVITRQIHVVGESFDNAYSSVIRTNELGLEDELKDSFTFLIVGQITSLDSASSDRKNLYNTIKWLLEEFKNDNNVKLVIKTNAGRNTHIDKLRVENYVNSIANSVGSKRPKITVVHGQLTSQQMKELYDNSTCLVTATCGEGFGLPILEAAACGLPIIATDWSAHSEYLQVQQKEKFVKLPYTLVNVPEQKVDGNIFVKGAKWAQVSENDFKKRVRKFFDSSKLPKEWAQELQPHIHKLYNSTVIEDKLLEVIRNV